MTSNVSVLIPAHGDAPYINETLHSISLSTLLPDEVVVVDDGLSESALKVVKTFQEILPILLLKNNGRGLVSALNTGLSAANYGIICRIDADDLMHNERILNQTLKLKSENQLVAIGSQCYFIDSKSKLLGASKYPTGILNDNPDFQRKCLIAHPSSMFYRDSAIAIGGYRSIFTWDGVDIAEDFDFWLRLAKVGKIEVTDQILTYYRQHENQLSSKNQIGQQIGTQYVCAVNTKEVFSETKRIEFLKGGSSQSTFLMHFVKEALGLKQSIVLFLLMKRADNNSFYNSRFVYRLTLRLVNFLSR
jgi:glycosyltransferase involved in cell wall biosynthesis